MLVVVWSLLSEILRQKIWLLSSKVESYQTLSVYLKYTRFDESPNAIWTLLSNWLVDLYGFFPSFLSDRLRNILSELELEDHLEDHLEEILEKLLD